MTTQEELREFTEQAPLKLAIISDYI